ncbi:hypothetical protein JCM8202v2_006007 [Rhodotorula sphaerocarpa]
MVRHKGRHRHKYRAAPYHQQQQLQQQDQPPYAHPDPSYILPNAAAPPPWVDPYTHGHLNPAFFPPAAPNQPFQPPFHPPWTAQPYPAPYPQQPPPEWWNAGWSGGPFHPSFSAFFPPGAGGGPYSRGNDGSWMHATPTGLGDHRQEGMVAGGRGHFQDDRPRGGHGERRRSRSRSPRAQNAWHYDPERPGGDAASGSRWAAHPEHASGRPRGTNWYDPAGLAAPEEDGPATAAYAPDGTYIPPERRKRRDVATAVIAPPTATYLAAADTPPPPAITEPAPGVLRTQAEPVTLVMDLNHTLLCRAKRNRFASKMPVVRPYLATFLTYLCTPDPLSGPPPSRESADLSRPTGGLKFNPIVYSSARAPNVLSMLAAINLIPPVRLSTLRFRATYEPRADEGDVLEMVFTREMMGLSAGDYRGDVETVKDLGKVWERLGWDRPDETAGAAAVEGEAEGEGEQADRSVASVDGSEAGDGERATQPDGVETTTIPSEPQPPRKRPNRKAKLRMATARDTTGAQRTLLLDDEAGKATQQPYSHLPIAPFLLHPSEIPNPNPAPAPAPSNPDPTAAASPSRASPASSSSVPASAAAPALPSAHAPRTAYYDSSALALQVEAHHPPAHDRHLLATIWQLEQLRFEGNLAFAVKGGALERLREEARRAVLAARSDVDGGPAGEEKTPSSATEEVSEADIAEEMARRGVAVCERLGIEVSREWVPDWRERLLAKRAAGIDSSSPAAPQKVAHAEPEQSGAEVTFA